MEDAAERRKRLKEIREAAQQTQAAPSSAPAAEAAEPTVPTVKFRNYKLRDESVQHEKVAAAKVPELNVPTTDADKLVTQQDIIEAYAPKKPHMDLKRDCAKRIAKLDRQTQRALRELAEELQAAAELES